MKVITDKVHKIYLSDKEVRTAKRLCKEKLDISLNRLANEHLGITRMTLHRKFARQQPFLWLEIAKLDYLGLLVAETHEQVIRLRNKI